MTATTKELIDTLTKTLKNINQSPTIPLPIFKGKKGEDPEDHILKVEDYFGVHQITEQKDKIDRFKDTLFETARKWAQTLNYTEVTKFDYDPANADDKIASMKYLFLARFAKEGRTLEAAYSAWGALTFDPSKDDIEQFILKLEELAKKLGYNEDAQVMTVKSVLPRDVYGICMASVRPFPISETDKPFMDDQMEKLVSLGILSKNSTSHTSPVMLITRKIKDQL